jgi:uncharacterized membrane protein HdeD (DUF308 family)
MLSSLTKHWWLLVLRGMVSILFAILAFANPADTFTALILVLGVFLLVDGGMALYLGARMRGEDKDWWIVLLEGLLGVGLGVLTLVNPDITAAGIVLFVALWCLITGVFEISTAIRLREEIDNEWLLGLAGVISIGLGILMLVNPNAGAFSIVFWIGIYAAFFGLLLVGLGLKMRKLNQA